MNFFAHPIACETAFGAGSGAGNRLAALTIRSTRTLPLRVGFITATRRFGSAG